MFNSQRGPVEHSEPQSVVVAQAVHWNHLGSLRKYLCLCDPTPLQKFSFTWSGVHSGTGIFLKPQSGIFLPVKILKDAKVHICTVAAFFSG